MTRVIGRPLEDIRSALGTPYLPAGAVSAAVHEAAHAVVGMAHGAIISSIYIRETARRYQTVWEGLCTYEGARMTVEEYQQFTIAGVIGSDFLHSSVTSVDSPFFGSCGDSRQLVTSGITLSEALATYRMPVTSILKANVEAFDHIAAALLAKCGDCPMAVLSEREILTISLLYPVTTRRKSTHAIEHRTMQHVSPGEVRL